MENIEAIKICEKENKISFEEDGKYHSVRFAEFRITPKGKIELMATCGNIKTAKENLYNSFRTDSQYGHYVFYNRITKTIISESKLKSYNR